MKTYKRPLQNNHDDIDTVINRLYIEYGIEPKTVPMYGLYLPETRKNDEWPKDIPIIILRCGQIYIICSYNHSLETACPMLKSILDDNEQYKFDQMYDAVEYEKALLFLTENTF